MPSTTLHPRDQQADFAVGTSQLHLKTDKVSIEATIKDASDEDDEQTLAAKLSEKPFKLREDLAPQATTKQM